MTPDLLGYFISHGEYFEYFLTKIIKAHITHMDYYHALKLF